MDAYIYQAALLCEDCGRAVIKNLTAQGKAPEDPDDEYTYDSDDFPKGPYPDGSGESDCPEHCDHCGVYLENDLTSDGVEYVVSRLAEYAENIILGEPEHGNVEVLDEWAASLEWYGLDDEDEAKVDLYRKVRRGEPVPSLDVTGRMVYRVDIENLGSTAKTALDIVIFEAEELGNTDTLRQANMVAEMRGLNLSRIKAGEVVWVTFEQDEVRKYLPSDEEGNDDMISSWELGKGSIILADDDCGGYLIYTPWE